jgi:pyruvate formate lyase activating enzyme
MIKGRIHSIESMGLVDGPGIRTVVFFQGCNLRCAYCHNPDTWCMSGGKEYSPEELVNKLIRFKPYFSRSGGGVTFSGGDPLMQPDFLIECLKLCKANGIHTTIDTSGFGLGKYKDILDYTDLVILDIKHVDNKGYISLTGKNRDELMVFLQTLNNSLTPVWIRHVVVPDITDSQEKILQIATFINEHVDNVKKIELLPYHTLGVQKYEKLNIPYRLADVSSMDKEKTSELQNILIEATIKKVFNNS